MRWALLDLVFCFSFVETEVSVCRAVALPVWDTSIRSGLILHIYTKSRITEILSLANPFDSDVRKSNTRVISQREIDVKKADIPISEDEKSKQERSDPRRSEATPTSTPKGL